MTDILEATEAVYQAFATGWGNRTPYCLGNEIFDPPEGPWLRVSIQELDRAQGSLGQTGNRRFESVAQVSAQYFEPPGQGVKTASGHMNFLRRIFEGVRIAGTTIYFEGVQIQRLGVVEDGRWYAETAVGRFFYDEII